MLKMGWITPNLLEIQDSIVKSILTKNELVMLYEVRGVVSPIKIHDKSSDNINIRDVYSLTLFYNSFDEKYLFSFAIPPSIMGYQKSCTFIVNNLSEIENAIKECIPSIKEKFGQIDQDRLSRIKTKEQESKCKSKLWTKFNQKV